MCHETARITNTNVYFCRGSKQHGAVEHRILAARQVVMPPASELLKPKGYIALEKQLRIYKRQSLLQLMERLGLEAR